jgi:kynurenine 3-monooxygenase
VPFHGQGMNCAFEDALALADLAHDASNLGARFQHERKINADAIADMAIENYVEMRDLVADPEFLATKALERALALRYPERFVPRYSLVSFTTTPYASAMAKGAAQLEILKRCRDLGYSAERCDWSQVDEMIKAL